MSIVARFAAGLAKRLCRTPPGVWVFVPAMVLAIGAHAQGAAVPALPITCSALTTLAENPPKAPELAAAISARVVAAAASVPPASTGSPTANNAVTQAVTNAVTQAVNDIAKASFKMPRLLLKSNTAPAEWGSRIELSFDTPIAPAVAKCLEAELVLFLDHHPLGITPIERIRGLTADLPGPLTIAYRIQRPASGGAGWVELLAKLWDQGGSKPVTVGVGVGTTEMAVATDRLNLTLGTGGPGLAWCALLGSALLLGLVWWQSKILEDRRGGPMSYSLSRLLLAAWVLTTVCAVLLTVLRTGAMPDTTEAGLALLLAVSGATTGLSGLIDLIRQPRNVRVTRFWEDFLDDADGLALHRVQVVAFNLLVLALVWREMIQLGTVARIDSKWSSYLGASALIFVFGKLSESNTASSRLNQPVAAPTSSQAPER